MKENQLRQVWYLLLLVIVFLFAIYWLPDFSIFGRQFKKPNLLADLQRDPPIIMPKDTIDNKKDSSVVKTIIIPKSGSAAIEEFGKDNLRYFFESIRHSRTRSVRIAFFGDSFIEGDILCGPFRDTLQRLYGGSGVGYMPITSEVTKFRTTIQHEFSNWNTFSMVGQRNENTPLGLPGYCFVPTDGNEVTYRPANRNFVTAKFFYESEMPVSVKYTLNDSIVASAVLNEGPDLMQFNFPGKGFSAVNFTFPSPTGTRLYGAALEDSVGISVDNFSMRSNPGMGLLLIDQERMKQFNSLRDYKLIVLQYGLNVLSENDTTGYIWYMHKMTALLKQLKESFPSSGFLLISVGDRCTNQNGKIATMPDVHVMRNIQRKIAQRSQVAFWDMFIGMGGENSMVKFTEAQPPLAAKDYTHLTFRGGRKIAKKLADALLREKKKYEKR
jgi:hypothetical protein